MLPCSWVAESGYVRASLVSLTPPSKPGGFGASDRERVEPDARTDPTCVRTAVAERQRDHAVRHSGEEPNRELERSAGIIEANPILVCEADRFGRLRADERGIIPGQLREGIGKLLQPPVVREAAVVKRGRGEEHDLQITRRSRRGLARRTASGAKAAELRQGLRGEVGDNFWKLAAGQETHRAERGSRSCRTRASPRIGFQVSRTTS